MIRNRNFFLFRFFTLSVLVNCVSIWVIRCLSFAIITLRIFMIFMWIRCFSYYLCSMYVSITVFFFSSASTLWWFVIISYCFNRHMCVCVCEWLNTFHDVFGLDAIDYIAGMAESSSLFLISVLYSFEKIWVKIAVWVFGLSLPVHLP